MENREESIGTYQDMYKYPETDPNDLFPRFVTASSINAGAREKARSQDRCRLMERPTAILMIQVFNWVEGIEGVVEAL